MEVHGNPLYQLVFKLKNVKQALKSWLKEENIHPKARILSVRQKLNLLHDAMATNPTAISLHKEENQLNKELNVCLAHDESHLRQKCRENWLKLRDKNSKFYFASLKNREAHNSLNHLLKSDGLPMTDIEEIKQQAPLFFEDLFTQDSYWTSFPDIIVRKKLTEKAKTWLIREVTDLEIEDALHQMPPEKAPGPDSYNAACFQKKLESPQIQCV